MGLFGIAVIICGICFIHLRSFSFRSFLKPFLIMGGKASLWSFCTGVSIAAYSIVDKIGSPIEIYEKPANEFIAGFVGYVNFLEGSVKTLRAREKITSHFRITSTHLEMIHKFYRHFLERVMASPKRSRKSDKSVRGIIIDFGSSGESNSDVSLTRPVPIKANIAVPYAVISGEAGMIISRCVTSARNWQKYELWVNPPSTESFFLLPVKGAITSNNWAVRRAIPSNTDWQRSSLVVSKPNPTQRPAADLSQ